MKKIVRISYRLEEQDKINFQCELKKHKMNMLEFSKKAGYSIAFVSMCINGQRNPPKKLLEAFKNILGIDLTSSCQ